METVNNLASAASRAIWGDQSTAEQDTTKNETAGQEPLSGQTGDVKSGEPYDKGNIGGPTTSSNLADTNTTSNKISATSDNSSGTSGTSQNVKSLLDPEPTSKSANNYSSTSTAMDPANGGSALGAPTNTSGTETERIRETKQQADNTANVTTGTGPRQLEERTKGTGVGGNDEVQKESHGTGTGEKYEKSTGLAADGGNFSAEKPGAGMEAKRLLDDQGIHRHQLGSTSTDNSKDDEEETGGKRSLKDKIKAKLHKH